MSLLKAKIPTSLATTGDLVELLPNGNVYPTGAITLLDVAGDEWWIYDAPDTETYVNNYDLYIEGTVVTQTEALNVWIGNKSIKVHMADTDIHTDSATKVANAAHLADITSNPHNVTVTQAATAEGVTVPTIDDTAGDGDTTVVWSADKLYEEFGTTDFSEIIYLQDVENKTTTNLLKKLAKVLGQLSPNTDGYTNNRILYSDTTRATGGAGDVTSQVVFTETSLSDKTKVTCVGPILENETTLKVRYNAQISTGTGTITVVQGIAHAKESEVTAVSYTAGETIVDVTDASGSTFIYVTMRTSSGGTFLLKDVTMELY